MTHRDKIKHDHCYNKEFRQAVQGTRRIHSSRINLQQYKVPKKPYQSSPVIEKDDDIPEHFSDHYQAELLGYEDTLKFHQKNVSFKQMHNLQKGNIFIEDHLDLHGLTLTNARKEITLFIHYALTHQIRYIRIIHGKGYKKDQQYPLLKNKVNSWLQQHPDVLAFHSATPKDGGTGAVYVYLRNIYKH